MSIFKRIIFLSLVLYSFIIVYFSFTNNIFANTIYDQIKTHNIEQVKKNKLQDYYRIKYTAPTRKHCFTGEDVKIKIYMYHYIRPSHRDKVKSITRINSVTPGNFEKQMQYLWREQKTHKTYVAHLSDITKRKQQSCFPYQDITILSFDDGWRDNFEYAFPILKKYKLKALFGIIWNRFSGDNKRIDPFMTINEIQQINNDPLLEIQSHSLTHTDLRNMDYEQQKKEICDSKIFLEKTFHTSINTFIVPMGYNTPYTTKIAKKCGYDYVLLTRPGIVSFDDIIHHPYSLKRIRVQRDMTGKELFGNNMR